MTTGSGLTLTEDESLMGNRPVVNWSSGTGSLQNLTYDGLSSKTQFTRVVVGRATSTSSMLAWRDQASQYDVNISGSNYYFRTSVDNTTWGRTSVGDVISSNHGGFVTVSTWDGDIPLKKSLNLDGTHFVQVNDHDRFAFGLNEFTLEGWVNFDSIGGDYFAHPFFSQKDGDNHYVFSYDPVSKRMILEINNNGTISKIYSNTWEPVIGEFNHVALTRREGVFNFYLNGVAHGEDYNFQTVPIPNIDSTFNFGSFEGTSFFDGKIDEFRVWDKVRSVNEIATYKTESIMERTPGLIAEYRFDGSLVDSSLSYNVTNLSSGVAAYVTDDASVNEVANKHKYRLRINSTDKTIEEYRSSGELVSPGAGLGASIGGSLSSDSHTWRGDIAEVIIFDRVLTYEEIVELETYLKRKWGIIEGCKLPADTTGYNVSQCNTAGEAEGLLG